MIDIQKCNQLVWFYILGCVLYCLLFFGALLLLFFILYRFGLMDKKGFRWSIRALGLTLTVGLIIWSIPSLIDLVSKSYYKMENIIGYTETSGAGRNVAHLMTVEFVDKDGEWSQCYNAVFDMNSLKGDKLSGYIFMLNIASWF